MPADLTRARADLMQQRQNALTNFVPSRISLDAPWSSQADTLKGIDTRLSQLDALERSRNAHNRLVNIGRVASAAPVALAAAPALGFGAASSAAPAASAASSAAPAVATAARFTLPNLLRFAEIGIPAVTQLFGMRSQNRAMDRQFDAEQRTYAQQLAMAQEQEAYRRAEADRVAKEEARRWEIEQQNAARQLAAQEEERAFNRRLIEERDARNQQRRMRLEQFLGLGR